MTDNGAKTNMVIGRNATITISLGLVVAIVLVVWQGSSHATNIQRDIGDNAAGIRDVRSDLAEIKASIATLDGRLTEGTHDRWRRIDMQVWIRELELLNPEIRVPETP